MGNCVFKGTFTNLIRARPNVQVYPLWGESGFGQAECLKKPRCTNLETKGVTWVPFGGGLTPFGIIPNGLASSTSRATWTLLEKASGLGRVTDSKALVSLPQSTETQTPTQ